MKLKYYRDKAEIKQGDIAEKLGVAQKTISHWESGKVTPTLVNAILTAEILGVRKWEDFREMWGI